MNNNANGVIILGPGGAAEINNSTRRQARKLIKSTVSKGYFKDLYKKRNRSQNYVAWNTASGALAGFAFLTKEGDELEISLIGASQGKGIGTRLIKQIIEDAKARGIKKITLDSVPSAMTFYRKLGFKFTSFNNNFSKHIRMNLKLNSPKPVAKTPTPAPVRRRVQSVRANPANTRRVATAARRTSARASAMASARAKK